MWQQQQQQWHGGKVMHAMMFPSTGAMPHKYSDLMKKACSRFENEVRDELND